MNAPVVTPAPVVVRGFTVHADGTIVGPSGRVLKVYKHPNGYVTVGRRDSGRMVREAVHRLVCEAFHGPPPTPDHHVAHWNGDPTDNRAENLRWATRAENYADSVRHGSAATGEGHGRAKLTWDQVETIRSEYAAGGVSKTELSRRYGVHRTTIYDIVQGRKWKGARP